MNGPIQSAGADPPSSMSGLMEMFKRLMPIPSYHDPREVSAAPPWELGMRTENYVPPLEDSDIAPTGATGGEPVQMPAIHWLLKQLFGGGNMPLGLGNRAIGADTNELRSI